MKRNNYKPMISVIMPAFNAEKYIGQAIQSIIDQDYQPLEIIVIDDESTDDTKKIVKSYQDITYIFQPHSGAAAARQKGIEVATGEFISFLDADDLWDKRKLQLQTKCLIENNDIDIVNAKMRNFIEPGENFPADRINPKIMVGREAMQLGTLLIRKNVMNKIGGFNQRLHYTEDFDWFVRMEQSGVRVKCLNEVLLLRRLHTKSHTYNNETAQQMEIVSIIALNRKLRRNPGS